MKLAAIIGGFLFTFSAPVLLLMAREYQISSRAYKTYSLEHILRNETVFHGHAVLISDEILHPPNEHDEDPEVAAPIHITINGQDYSSPATAMIKPARHGSSRYNGYVSLIIVRDRSSGEERLSVCQRIPGLIFPGDTQFRILFVNPDGKVTEEIFKYAARTFPLYRTMLARLVSPIPIGFISNVNCLYPTLFYPFLYPWGTSLIGLILLGIGAANYIKFTRSTQNAV